MSKSFWLTFRTLQRPFIVLQHLSILNERVIFDVEKLYKAHVVFYYLVDSSPYAVCTCSSEFYINKNKINTCKKCKKKKKDIFYRMTLHTVII